MSSTAAELPSVAAAATVTKEMPVTEAELPSIASLTVSSSPVVESASPVAVRGESDSPIDSSACSSTSPPAAVAAAESPAAAVTTTPIPIASTATTSAASASMAASLAPGAAAVGASGELLNGGYKRGGAENDPETGVYDEIEIEDMEYDEDTETYTYPCPCGDKFSITKEDLLDGEDIARCPSCSLLLKIIYDPDDLEEED